MKLQYDKNFTIELLKSTEENHPKSNISRLLDKIELDESIFNYTLFNDHRIHLPNKIEKIEKIQKNFRREVMASFFS